MKSEFRIALRHSFLKRSSLVRFTKFLAIFSIAFAVAVMIIAQALSEGFSSEIREKILSNEPHIRIFQKDGSKIQNWQEIEEALRKRQDVISVESVFYESAFAVSYSGSSYCVLKGKGSVESVTIGRELAEKLQIKLNEPIQVFLFLESQVKSFQLKPAEIFKTGLYDYDASLIYVPKSLLEKESFGPNVLEIKIENVYSAEKTASEIRSILGNDFRTISWQESNQALFEALSLERTITFLIVSLLFFIASLNIATTLALLVNERRLDIAVLKVLGAKTKSLIMIFLFEGLILSCCGIAIGFFVGLLSCFLVNYFSLISLPASVYAISEVRLSLNARDAIFSLLISLAVSAIASVYPAFLASRLKPTQILRGL